MVDYIRGKSRENIFETAMVGPRPGTPGAQRKRSQPTFRQQLLDNPPGASFGAARGGSRPNSAPSGDPLDGGCSVRLRPVRSTPTFVNLGRSRAPAFRPTALRV